jgi:hypothetical protein
MEPKMDSQRFFDEYSRDWRSKTGVSSFSIRCFFLAAETIKNTLSYGLHHSECLDQISQKVQKD